MILVRNTQYCTVLFSLVTSVWNPATSNGIKKIIKQIPKPEQCSRMDVNIVELVLK